jgi:hypothetical protein
MRLSSIVALAGSGFFVVIFFVGGGGVEKGRFYWGFLKKMGVWTWRFGGENVVRCVVNVVFWMGSFERRKM